MQTKIAELSLKKIPQEGWYNIGTSRFHYLGNRESTGTEDETDNRIPSRQMFNCGILFVVLDTKVLNPNKIYFCKICEKYKEREDNERSKETNDGAAESRKV